jgi:hypothetical protein
LRVPWLAVVGAVALALALSADARACVCADAPMGERLDRADAAVVGTVRTITDPDWDVPTQARLMLFQVDQRVKGDVRGETVGQAERIIFVQTPLGTDCDVPTASGGRTTGLLLTKTDEGRWYATACSLVDPGQLVAAGGEPRGGVIKVAIGLVILGLVLAWSLRRLRRGARPDLPGAPEP